MRWLWWRFVYRPFMRLAHRFNWHHAPPCYPDGDTQLWCDWCGFRQTIKRGEWRGNTYLPPPRILGRIRGRRSA